MPTEKLKIVPMIKAHTLLISKLEKACFSSPWSQNSLDIVVEDTRAYFVTALYDGKIAGYGGLHFSLDEFYVDNIAVFESHRRCGIGSAVVQTLLLFAKEHDGAFLSLEVRPSNPAVNLYKKLGFKEVGRRRNFYSSPVEDGLLQTYFFGQ